MMESIFSAYYDNVVMLAAVVSLLLVILFVLILHIYAKLFLSTTNNSSSPRSPLTTYYVYDNDKVGESDGLDLTEIKSIPSFVYTVSDAGKGEEDGVVVVVECAICLGVFEEGEVGRKLPRCSHTFHLECIDKWLGSKSTCPICRYPVLAEVGVENDDDQAATKKMGEEQQDSVNTARLTHDAPPMSNDDQNQENLPIEIVVEVPYDDDEDEIERRKSSSTEHEESIISATSTTTVSSSILSSSSSPSVRPAASSSFSGLSSIITRPLLMMNRRTACRSDQFRVHPSSTTDHHPTPSDVPSPPN